MHVAFCFICGFPINRDPVPMLWFPKNDREEPIHESCKKFHESSRPPVEERRRRWLEQKASLEDDTESGSTG
jgi:hypothetical protein